jgi:CRISPR/Cas system CMR subunit Cmr6 (Cas7 group RAMP superfamily)
MLSLPTQRPKWYGLKDNEERGWTPLTSDIINNPQNREIVQAWALENTYQTSKSQKATLKLERLRILSPIQVGGYILPEGGILPAQIGGVPCIPGSSLRGAFLHYLRQQWGNISPEEQTFWQSLIQPDRKGWQPRAIRFEIIWLNNLGPYPLNAQQKWQLFDTKENKLGVQWQVNPKPPNPNPDRFSLGVLIPKTIGETEKKWLKQRLEEMLLKQGIGRGTHSGFGRLAERLPEGNWEITLKGMKPAICGHKTQGGEVIQQGQYRWSPQVLIANLRSLFHRLAFSQLSSANAQRLTDIIFGSFNGPALLTLTSFLHSTPRQIAGQPTRNPHTQPRHNAPRKYNNIPQEDANSTWLIKADCNPEFYSLISQLLALASRIGGLGPAWRRPPHEMRNGTIYRGSQFTVTGLEQDNTQSVVQALQAAIATVQDMARQQGLQLIRPNPFPNGCIQSIWQGNPDQWEDIVHGVCSTNASNRPAWCGNTTSRPSGYSVRQYDDKSLITVFDPAVEASLRSQGFTRIWPS